MSFHYQLLSILSPIFSIIRKIGVFIGFVSKNRLRVLAYHDIPESEEIVFTNHINWLKEKWNIVSPAEFEMMISGKKPIIGSNVLITFDDGFISNKLIAEKILNPLGVKAIFFVISDFVEIKNRNKSYKFASTQIVPGSIIKNIPRNWENMQWADLAALIEQGHTIGCHTKTHARLSDIFSIDELEMEIIQSAEKISHKLGVDINHFAFTFGNIDSFSRDALQVAKKKFDFIYSGIRGVNLGKVSPFAIRRDAVAYQLKDNTYKLVNKKLLSVFMDGFVDIFYGSARKKIDKWSKEFHV